MLTIQYNLILITLIIVPCHQGKTTLLNVLETDNVTHKINSDIHKLVNKIFIMLKLNTNFTKKLKVNTLLIVHNDFVNISKNYYQIYNKIKDAVQVDNDENTSDVIFNIMKTIEIEDNTSERLSQTHGSFQIGETTYNSNKIEYVENEIIKGKELNRFDKINDYNSNKNIINYANSNNFVNDTNEVLPEDFIQSFLSKLNALSAKDFTDNYQNLNSEEEYIENYRRRSKGDLKIWVPHNFTSGVNRTRRIYNGHRSTINDYPFIVSVHVMGQFMCAGSIISKDLIITAASCLQIAYNNRLYLKSPRSVYIRIGSNLTNKLGEVVPVIEIYFHPLYNPKTLEDNLAIARLEKFLKFRYQKRVKRIIYDKEENRLPDTVNSIYILGWGAKTKTGTIAQHQRLSVSQLNIYDQEDCIAVHSRYYVNEKNFCAGFTSRGGGACNKDVGAPAVVNGTLTGVVSFGPPICGTVAAPTVFTQLGYYGDWIDNIVNMEREIIYKPTTKRKHHGNNIARMQKSPDQTLHATSKTTTTKLNTFITDYPKEITLLRKLIDDILKNNKTLVDDIIYGDVSDELEDFFATKTQKVDIFNHHMINKSIIVTPDVFEKNENVKTSPFVLTTFHRPTIDGTTRPLPPGFTTDIPEDLYEMIKERDNMMTTTPGPTTSTTTHPTFSLETGTSDSSEMKIGRGIFHDRHEKSSEDSLNDNEESSSFEDISIDVDVTQLNRYLNNKVTNTPAIRSISRVKEVLLPFNDGNNIILGNKGVIKPAHPNQFDYETKSTSL